MGERKEILESRLYIGIDSKLNSAIVYLYNPDPAFENLTDLVYLHLPIVFLLPAPYDIFYLWD